MAKTLWPSTPPFGFITPALMESYWGINANTGHNHRGQNSDGSCPKVQLDDEVSDFVYDDFQCKVTNVYFNQEVTFEVRYITQAAKLITLFFPTGITGLINGSRSTFRIEAVTDMPLNFLSNGAAPEMPALIFDNSNVKSIGTITMPTIADQFFTVSKLGGNFIGTTSLSIGSFSFLRFI